MVQDSGKGAAFVAGGAAAGAWVSVAVGGMGLAFKGTAISLGMTPIAAVGAVTGAATYGVFKAVVEGDASALGAAAVGGLGGAGASVTVGGMGLAFKGTAISLGMAPVTVAGVVVGFAVYGLLKIIDGAGCREAPAQTFERMEEKISWQEDYNQALIELNLAVLEETLLGDAVEQKFAVLEIEEELQALKEQTWVKNASNLNFTQFKDVEFNFSPSNPSLKSDEPDTQVKALSIEAQQPQAWECAHALKGHSAPVNSIAFHPDGQILASGSDDGIDLSGNKRE